MGDTYSLLNIHVSNDLRMYTVDNTKLTHKVSYHAPEVQDTLYIVYVGLAMQDYNYSRGDW